MSPELIELLEHILATFGAFVLLASMIVKFTPSKKDDEVMNKVVAYFIKVMDTLRTLGVKPKTKEIEEALKKHQ